MPLGLQHTFLPLSPPSLLQRAGPFLTQQSRRFSRSLLLFTASPEEQGDPAGTVQEPVLLSATPIPGSPFVLYYSALLARFCL